MQSSHFFITIHALLLILIPSAHKLSSKRKSKKETTTNACITFCEIQLLYSKCLSNTIKHQSLTFSHVTLSQSDVKNIINNMCTPAICSWLNHKLSANSQYLLTTGMCYSPLLRVTLSSGSQTKKIS